jgi:indolepyruvate ferredoxin oxidoreductase, beta subunit
MMNASQKRLANVIIAGVGGQGSILTSHLLAAAALRDGLDVKLAETFGAATRGGSVLAHVRLGEAWSPIIPPDEADVVAALEPLEGLRVAAQYLKPGGWALLNTRPWYPVDVSTGRVRYPSMDDIANALRRLAARVLVLDATELAVSAGDARALNTVLLGCLFALDVTGVNPESLFAAMRERWSERLFDINRRAYGLGWQVVMQKRSELPC